VAGAGGGNALRVWDLSGKSLKERTFSVGPDKGLTTVAWSPDGSRVTTVAGSDEVWTWEWDGKHFEKRATWAAPDRTHGSLAPGGAMFVSRQGRPACSGT